MGRVRETKHPGLLLAVVNRASGRCNVCATDGRPGRC